MKKGRVSVTGVVSAIVSLRRSQARVVPRCGFMVIVEHTGSDSAL